jgi:hypothetical protein
MKPLTFSRFFPSYHPRAGKPTFFVEKIWNSIQWNDGVYAEQFHIPYDELGIDFLNTDAKKHHTIRFGRRWKTGDWFKPVVWTGKPYCSKQIQFAPPIQVKQIWDIDVEIVKYEGVFKLFLWNNNEIMTPSAVIAANDGLSWSDFYHWFVKSKKPMPKTEAQIICWSDEKIKY